MLSARLRTRVSAERLEAMVGKVLTDSEYDLLLTGPAKLIMPDGRPLCIYLPRAIPEELRTAVYPDLHAIRGTTENRGLASGSRRVKRGRTRTSAKPVTSSIIGYFEASQPFGYCRLTAFTAKEVSSWDRVKPFFQFVAGVFAEHVPDRYAAQVSFARQTKPEWVIEGTPFTTITVNNTYPTGVHTDKGDLDEGFSALAVLRRGAFSGGRLTFPEYRVAVDMQDGDLILMDAHQWHGNTILTCDICGDPLDRWGHQCDPMPEHTGLLPGDKWLVPERISIVHYFRTGMVKCDTFEEEQARAERLAERRSHV